MGACFLRQRCSRPVELSKAAIQADHQAFTDAMVWLGGHHARNGRLHNQKQHQKEMADRSERVRAKHHDICLSAHMALLPM